MSPLNSMPSPEDAAQAADQLKSLLGESLCRALGVFTLPAGLRISVVVPVYNEKDTLLEIIRRIRAVPIPKQIILVDDGSTDGTRDLLATLDRGNDVRVVLHQRNQGKGAAVRTGFAQATGDIVLIQDADLEYDPGQYHRLIQPIVEGVADVVYGSRFLAGGRHRVLYYWHSVGNHVLTTISNMVTDLNLTDMEACYKAFRREIIQSIRLEEDRFGFEPEVTIKIAHRPGIRIYEMPISYHGRRYDQGKKIGAKDGFRALYCLAKYGLLR